MLGLSLNFFDKLVEKCFLDGAAKKITDALDARNVKRQISKAAEMPAQMLANYFSPEGLNETQIHAVLASIEDAIDNADITAKMLASTSLDAEKLTRLLLDKYPTPTSLQAEGLEWPYRMALKISAESLCHIGTRFADWECAAWSRTFDAFDRLAENQEGILKNQEEIQKNLGPSFEGAEDKRFAQNYRAHIVRRLGIIDGSTLRVSSALAVDLPMVFVQPDVMESTPLDIGEELASLEQLAPLEEARQELIEHLQAKFFDEHRAAETFVTEHARCAIVGSPGSGKTTLLQHLLLSIAKGHLRFDDQDRLLPILVRVRQLDANNLPSIEALLHLESRIFENARHGFLNRQFQAGHVVLLIDGLDEIVEDKCDSLFDWIGQIVQAYPKARYIVSSRPAGYRRGVFQDLSFRECILSEFNDDQICDYVYRWTKAVCMTKGDTAEEADQAGQNAATQLVSSVEQNPYVRRLATNPLLLSTLCLVQRFEGGELPNRRALLYERCVEGLLFHWDHKRKLPEAILGRLPLERRLLLLRRAALAMQQQGVAEIDQPKLLDIFAQAFAEVGEALEAEDVLDNIRDRSGLLVERRPGIYGFSHLAFQEYLTAQAVFKADDPKCSRLFLFSKRLDPQWKEVISLYAGMANRNSVKAFIASLIEMGETESILLSGECLATATEMAVETRQSVLGKIFSLPYAAHNEVGKLLCVLDRRDVHAAALDALSNLEPGHAQRWLLGIDDVSTLCEVIKKVAGYRGDGSAGEHIHELYGLYEVSKEKVHYSGVEVETRYSEAVESSEWYRKQHPIVTKDDHTGPTVTHTLSPDDALRDMYGDDVAYREADIILTWHLCRKGIHFIQGRASRLETAYLIQYYKKRRQSNHYRPTS